MILTWGGWQGGGQPARDSAGVGPAIVAVDSTAHLSASRGHGWRNEISKAATAQVWRWLCRFSAQAVKKN